MEDKNSDHAKIMKFCYPYAVCKDFQMSSLHIVICEQKKQRLGPRLISASTGLLELFWYFGKSQLLELPGITSDASL